MVNISKSVDKSEDTKDIIAQVASHLFARQGYDGTSIRDISYNANVTKPVIYYYYESKEHLFITLIHEAYELFFEKLEQVINSHDDFMSRLRDVTRLYFDLTIQFEDTVRLMYHVAFAPRNTVPNVDILELDKKHMQYIGQLFAEGMEKGVLRKGNLDQHVLHYIGTISVYLQTFLLYSEPIPENIVDIILDFVLNGIGGKAS